ncbi:DUF3325 domain-containing protein [Phenylobacterium sp. LjRoot219]|uniref:DUF3325 domain-containing protein n=1 Tax=Phenylobacterium sp. LjRoot219 TaxID=3342283 RepID=UPI003ECFE4C9
MILLSILFALAGLGALGLSQPQHYGWARGRAASAQERRLLQASGWSLLALSFGLAVGAWGPARGLIGWCGGLTLAAAGLVLFRTYGRPRPIRR